MYLAHFNAGDEDVVQALVTLPALPRLPPAERDGWWHLYGELLRGLDAVDGAGAGLRIIIAPGRTLRRALFVCAPEACERDLRRFVAPFVKLDATVPGSVLLPLDRQEYDGVAGDFPLLRGSTTNSAYVTDDAWLSCDFRLASVLSSLIRQAESHEFTVGYQVNIRPLVVDRDSLRQAHRNTLRLRDVAGLPAGVAEGQRALAEKLGRAAMVCTEYLAADSWEAVRWLRRVVAAGLEHQHASLKCELSSLEFEKGGQEDELSCPNFVADENVRVDALCASAVDRSEAQALLGWRPDDRLADRLAAPAPPPGAEPSEKGPFVGDAPPSYEGHGSYVFISYKRSDLAEVAPLIRRLHESGVNVWYDRGIPGGAEWLAVLEERIRGADAVLLFLSRRAVQSKYVRREVTYADGFGMTIIGIQLEEVTLDRGLGLILHGSQMLTRSAKDFDTQLERALRHAAKV